MTVEELVRHGVERETAGDSEGAERAYREADELSDAEGAILLGTLLKRRGELEAAADAFRRAEGRGHPEAAASLGSLLWDNGDTAGAKAAYERSVAAGSANGVLNLGLLLAQQGAGDEALPHLRSAEEEGIPEASWAIGRLLEDRGDLTGAADAYRRGADSGNGQAAFGLAGVLSKVGDEDGERAALQRASQLGHEGAAKILERLDAEPRIVPLSEGEERLLQSVHRPDGNRNDIYVIHRRPSDDETMRAGEPINFVAVIRSTDADPNDTSPPWAWKRGPSERSIYIAVAEAIVNAPPLPGTSVSLQPDLQWFVDRSREDAGPTPNEREIAANWAQLYVAACGDVLTTGDACIQAAQRAVGARNKAAERPQHEISIRNFTRMAEEAEQEFPALYRSFDEACALARDTAAQLLASQSDPLSAEMLVAMSFDQATLDKLATVKGILSANYGPSPAAVMQGIQETNELIQRSNQLLESTGEGEGNIYRPRAPAQSDERTCPWCAETIKAAAVICRFCGREVEVHPNVA